MYCSAVLCTAVGYSIGTPIAYRQDINVYNIQHCFKHGLAYKLQNVKTAVVTCKESVYHVLPFALIKGGTV